MTDVRPKPMTLSEAVMHSRAFMERADGGLLGHESVGLRYVIHAAEQLARVQAERDATRALEAFEAAQ